MDNSVQTETVYRVYEFDSDEYRRGLLLRAEILRITEGIADYYVNLVFGLHDGEKDHIFVGAFRGKNLIGTVSLAPQENGSLMLRQFAVDTKLQGQGIGRKLIDTAHEAARERGFRHIELHARQNVVGFYEKAGYAPNGKVHSSPSLTTVEMEREL